MTAGPGPDQAQVQGPDAKQPPIGFFRRLVLALLGGAGYRTLASQRRGWYPYFIIIAACTATVVTIVIGTVQSRSLTALDLAWGRVPDFTVSGGKLTVPSGVSLPVRIAVPGAIVELTTDSTAKVEAALAPAWLIVNNTGMTVLLGTGLERQVPFADLGSTTIDKSTIGTTLTFLRTIGLWVEGIISVLYQIGRDFVRALITAWIALTIVRLFGRNPSWPETWRVGMAAWTLPLLVEVVGAFVAFPAWSLWVVAGFYAITGCLLLDTRELNLGS